MGYLKDVRTIINEAVSKTIYKHKLDDGFEYRINTIGNHFSPNQDKYIQKIYKDGKEVISIGTHPSEGGNPQYKKFTKIDQYLDKFSFLRKDFEKWQKNNK